MVVDYIDYETAIKIYTKTVEKSGGGMTGIRDEGGIRTVLENIQNDLYYPEMADKAAYMMFSLCRGHYFTDCNKRISITLTMYFFLLNGYMYVAKDFMKIMEEPALDLAAGCMDKDTLTEMMHCIVNDNDYSESLLLSIANGRAKRIELEKQFK